jgi:sugar phosphate isomerase/epimerase
VDFDAFFEHLKSYGYHGDYTVEATAFDRSGTVDTEMLNECFANLRGRIG